MNAGQKKKYKRTMRKLRLAKRLTLDMDTMLYKVVTAFGSIK